MFGRRAVFVIVGLIATGLISSWGTQGRSEAASLNQRRPLRVVTKEIPPFVIKDQDRLTGFSIDIWEKIAQIADIDFEYVEVETVGDQLATVESGEADLAIAAISMTPEREERIDFSYPYYRSGLQILATNSPSGAIAILVSAFLSPGLLFVFLFLLLLMAAVGHVVWLTERKSNPHFPKGYLRGVWEGIWWAAVTMTTVGYGDTHIKRVPGRIVALIWMFSGILLIAYFTAAVTSELTVAELKINISGPDELLGHKVATVAETTSADWLEANRIPFVPVSTIEEAYELLEQKAVEAVVYDAPVLQYYVATTGGNTVKLVGTPFKIEDYGIALPPGSPHEEAVNLALLELYTSGIHQEVRDKWFVSGGE